MSKSAEIYRKNLPFYYPIVGDIPPSRAARFLAKAFRKEDRSRLTVVDAGCGEGRDTLFLLREGFHVIALDASERNLKVLSQKSIEANIASGMLECRIADLAKKIPIGDSEVDALLDVWVLGPIILRYDGKAGAIRYLKEVYRVLKLGGLFVSEFETLIPNLSSEELKKYFANLVKGFFSIITLESIETDYVHYLAIQNLHRIEENSAILAITQKEDIRRGVKKYPKLSKTPSFDPSRGS
ncbi:class I SAM-dependent methyltransferase [Candidatus Bathyarchaeota archaeon]|nr:class I SAM-dependent methyltransferase [Candidatus Bathyarchaeota archaeon]